MYKLTVAFGGRTIERREVDGEEFSIGRSPECDLVIDNLGVSRRHAEIDMSTGAPVLKDLKSNNGTFVNGRRVVKHHLNDGDEIAIGKFTITFNNEVLEDEVEEVVKKPAGGGDYTLAIDGDVMAARQRQRASKLKAYLKIEKRRGAENMVIDRGIFTIGKLPSCNLRVGGWKVAKKHAIIFRDEVSFRIVDVSQKGRTSINGTPVDEERLKDGDIIELPGHKIRFMVGTPPM
jgi:pSer/pThr/pTyr-binding forkhead associated (FHA) protein